MKDTFIPLALPHLKMFDRAQCEQIHLASLEVLRRTGVRVYQDEALTLLEEAGAHVGDGNLVKMPASLVARVFSSTIRVPPVLVCSFFPAKERSGV